MNSGATKSDDPTEGFALPKVRGRLFGKYVTLFVAVVCVALVTNGMFEIWFSYQEQKNLLIRVQRAQAEATTEKISGYVDEIGGQMRWITQYPLPWTPSTQDEWRFDAARLLRQVPAITELAQLDASGHEQIRVSRLATDVIGRQTDFSHEPKFTEAVANKIYYGPVYYHRETEPYMTMALAGGRREAGVSVAEVNLKFIWDVVSKIKVGEHGQAYVVDGRGRLIAHPDISLVLRNTDLSHLVQVQEALAQLREGRLTEVDPARQAQVAEDLQGRQVLTVHAPVVLEPRDTQQRDIIQLGWTVFVELPVDEAYAPLLYSIARSSVLLLGALLLAFLAGLFLARKMVVPIQALRAGAERIGGGDLGQRISIKTGDELEALGNQFNSMAARLQDSYANLERKVEERTHQLALANLAKSRFLAAASHDLRQPLHALGLFVAQLRARLTADERAQVVDRIDAAVAAMDELFSALLDISKLDAGVLAPTITAFPIARLLTRLESTFAGPAREKGLSLRVMPSSAWVRSDAILLERILLNLVSNAIRYTADGGVVVGCRRRGNQLCLEVHDSGPGIPEDQRLHIFGEFYQVAGREGTGRGGLGLGLAIVDRLCGLLEHPIELKSVLGKGSRFAVAVPLTVAQSKSADMPERPLAVIDGCAGKLVVVVDDELLVLQGMGGLLRSWGCEVLTAGTYDAASAALAEHERPPDLIISDYRLSGGMTGVEVIEGLRSASHASIPAFLVSGDISAERLREARARGYHLLHKPVRPMALRAMLSQMLKKHEVAGAA